ncbi:hypothetical protein CEY00_Acc28767 [Actinidia chinensis var. chinensis]|uniref:Uncharacterized protein n=1 Tax=Actinidia chinensis var. chinensis TaxID=1590841 RepID=A0A2R6PI14_ACTCC|nr:hypothetical protein CEY00_Acc28767 [Actinidia chinensis var. chinensis]
MEREPSSCSVSAPQEASNYDEIFMQHSLLFADNLKDLKNIRKQLYSAAEYFERSYDKDDQKHIVVESVKDYITKAIVNTVDHLGSVAYKVNHFLDEKVDQFSGTELQFSCIEQRLRICQEFSERSGVLQQSLLIKTPKYQKQYTIPEKMPGISETESVYNNCSPSAENGSYPSKNDVQVTTVKPHSYLLRKDPPSLPSMGAASSPGNFSFARTVSQKELERSVSPECFPIRRAGSLGSRPNIPKPSNAKQQWSEELRRSASVSTQAEKNMTKQIQQYSKKSKPLYKFLFDMLKQKKDGKLHR